MGSGQTSKKLLEHSRVAQRQKHNSIQRIGQSSENNVQKLAFVDPLFLHSNDKDLTCSDRLFDFLEHKETTHAIKSYLSTVFSRDAPPRLERPDLLSFISWTSSRFRGYLETPQAINPKKDMRTTKTAEENASLSSNIFGMNELSNFLRMSVFCFQICMFLYLFRFIFLPYS